MATNPSSQPPAVIGSTTIYHGTEHSALHGYRVQVVAVLKNIAPGPDNTEILSTDEAIAEAGGVVIGDRVEVRPWLDRENRWSSVTYDPRAEDLTMFAHRLN